MLFRSIETMFTALKNIKPSHLMDPALYDFIGLKTQDQPFDEGDVAFDNEEVGVTESKSEPVVFYPSKGG